MPILDQLAVDVADFERRNSAPRQRGVRDQRWWRTTLHELAVAMQSAVEEDGWSRDDLIALVDHVLAQVAAEADHMALERNG
jgi:hypothetical protein